MPQMLGSRIRSGNAAEYVLTFSPLQYLLHDRRRRIGAAGEVGVNAPGVIYFNDGTGTKYQPLPFGRSRSMEAWQGDITAFQPDVWLAQTRPVS